MVKVFTPHDINQLISAFPPSTPTINHPSLVKNDSGNALVDSTVVSTRFKHLLETFPHRIRKGELPAKLGVASVDWILEQYHDLLLLEQDGLTIIPKTEQEKIVQRLKSSADQGYVNVADFASSERLGVSQLDRLIFDGETGSDLRQFAISNRDQYVVSETRIEADKQRIRQAILSHDGKELDLSATLAISPAVVHALATEVIQENTERTGKVQLRENKAWFVPDAYASQTHEPNPENSLDRLLLSFRQKQYAEIPPDCETARFQEELAKDSKGGRMTIDLVNLSSTINNDDNIRVVATAQLVDKLLSDLRHYVETDPLGGKPLSADRAPDYLSQCTSDSRLALLLSQSRYREGMEDIVTQVQAKQRRSFVDLLQTTVLAPLSLYLTGNEAIQEPTLQARVQEFLVGYLQHECILPFLQQCREQNLLHEKTRTKETNKMAESAAQAKTLVEMQSIMLKFAKKQNVATPQPQQLHLMKVRVLNHNAMAIQRMKRGSDVLQHLIWNLLGVGSEGLFRSSGKDTSRMIKHYQSIGDEGKGRKLEEWRDLLKGGNESREVLQEMRAMSLRVMEEYSSRHDIAAESTDTGV